MKILKRVIALALAVQMMCFSSTAYASETAELTESESYSEDILSIEDTQLEEENVEILSTEELNFSGDTSAEGDYKGIHYVYQDKTLVLTGTYTGGSFGTKSTSAPWKNLNVETVDATKLYAVDNASAQGMFAGMSTLRKVDLGTNNFSNVSDVSYMFYGDKLLTHVHYYSSNATDASYMYYGCSGMNDIYQRLPKVKKVDYIYSNCSSAMYLGGEFGSLVNGTVESAVGFASVCNRVQKIDLRGMHFQSKSPAVTDFFPTNATFMIYLPGNFVEIDLPSNAEWVDPEGNKYTKTQISNKNFCGCLGKQLTNGFYENDGVKDTQWQLSKDGTLTISYTSGVPYSQRIPGLFEEYYENDFVAYAVKKIIVDSSADRIEAAGGFKYMPNCNAIEFKDSFNNSTGNIKRICYWFEYDKSLENIDLSKMKAPANAVDMSGTFRNCTSLKLVKWPNAMIKVSDADDIFKNTAMDELDFSHFDFSEYELNSYYLNGSYYYYGLNFFMDNVSIFKGPVNAPSNLIIQLPSIKNNSSYNYFYMDENGKECKQADIYSAQSKSYSRKATLEAPTIESEPENCVCENRKETIILNNYPSASNLKLTLYYTLDGSEPTINSSKVDDSGWISFEGKNPEDEIVLKVCGYSDSENIYTETLTRKYTFSNYTVSFDSQGGSSVDKQILFGFEKPVKPANPKRDGYVFSGWYLDKECTRQYSFDYSFGYNPTLYAKWSDKPSYFDSYNVIAGDTNGYWIGEDKSLNYSSKHEFTYCGYGVTPEWNVFYKDEKMLTAGTDYRISYKYNVNVSTTKTKAQCTVKFLTVKEPELKAEFTIIPYDISKNYSELQGKLVINPIPAQKANGKQLKPALPKIMFVDESKNIKINVTSSFKAVGYGENKEHGYKSGSVYIKGAGNFTGTDTIYFIIYQYKMKDLKISTAKEDPKWISSFEYDGTEKKQNLVLRVGNSVKGEKLTEGKDYTVLYTPNVEAGKVTVTYASISTRFYGDFTRTFRIKGKNIATATLRDANNNNIKIIPSVIYNGKAQDVWKTNGYKLSLYDKKTKTYTDIPASDYEISYFVKDKQTNINAGTATITITGRNVFATSSRKITFKITPYDLSDEMALDSLCSNKSVVYVKNQAACPTISSMTIKGMKLSEGTDYTLIASRNKAVTTEAKPAVLKVAGKGNFKGNRTYNFTITQKDISTLAGNVTVSPVKVNSKNRTKGDFRASRFVIKDTNGKALTTDDYDSKTLRYYNNKTGAEIDIKASGIPVGTIITVEVTAKGNYKGTMKFNYVIESK